MIVARCRDWLRDMYTPDHVAYRGGRGGMIWSGIFINPVGALLDLSIQMFTVLLLGAGIVSTLRGDRGGVPGRVLALLGGVLLLGLLVSRIVRRTYVLDLRLGPLEMNTTSVPYFVCDLAWLALGARWLYGSLTTPDLAQPPDPAFSYGGPVIVLGVATMLFGLRIWSRVLAWSTRR